MDTKEKRLEKIFDKYKCDDGLMVLLEDEVNEFYYDVLAEIKRAYKQGQKDKEKELTENALNKSNPDYVASFGLANTISKLERER